MNLRKLHISIAIVLIFGCVAACAPASERTRQPRAERGVIDLRGWRFDADGPVSLSGQWRFHWRQFDEPRSLSPNDPAPAFIDVPGSWNGCVVDGAAIADHGYATYALRVLVDPAAPPILALKTGSVQTAYRLFVNGRPLLDGGRPGMSPATTKPGSNLSPAGFERGTGDIDIVVHVANFHHRIGGINAPVQLGTLVALGAMRERAVAYEMFLFGGIFIIALYHISLFLLRRSDRSSLWFGLYCFAIALFDITMGEVHWGTGGWIDSWEFRMMLVNLSFYASAPFFTRFCHALFPEEVPRVLVLVMDSAALFFAGIVLVTPARVFSQTEQVYQVFTLVVALSVIALLVKALRRGREGAAFLLAGLMVLFLAALNDILHDNEIVATGYFIPLGLLAFICLQAFWLSRRSAHAFTAVERLSNELGELNASLADKVEDRTRELHAAMTEMEAINDRLLETNRSLEDARRVADEDMTMAFNVQASVLPREDPVTASWDIAHVFLPMTGVSGDFYDYYTDDDRLQGAGIFDVSGHGISSGLVTMIAKTILFRLFHRHPGMGLGDILSAFNREIYHEIGKAQYYLSGVLLRFDEGTVEYANAGHPDIVVKRGNRAWPAMGDREESLTGFLLGVRDIEYPYEVITVETAPEDFLVLFTDGLTEARNVDNELFSYERVLDAVARARPGTARAVLDQIMDSFSDFVKGRTRLSDDLTIIVLRRR